MNYSIKLKIIIKMDYISIKTLSLEIIVILRLVFKKPIKFINNNPIKYYVVDGQQILSVK